MVNRSTWEELDRVVFDALVFELLEFVPGLPLSLEPVYVRSVDIPGGAVTLYIAVRYARDGALMADLRALHERAMDKRRLIERTAHTLEMYELGLGLARPSFEVALENYRADLDGIYQQMCVRLSFLVPELALSGEGDPAAPTAVGPSRSELAHVVLLVEELSAVKDERMRSQIIERLPNRVQAFIPYSAMRRAHVTSIVESCARFPGGLLALRDAVHWLEGDTLAMKQLDAVLVSMSLDCAG
ncbi:effector-associated domain 2-containing protein [Haliangium sp.]|uniref:effector-associated domain 2-containing protein n=1 Tax=Haliangium sp. TaxID=2663208 RepID=UPI003D0FCA80